MELNSSINNNVFTIRLLESLHLHNAQDFKYFFTSRVRKKLRNNYRSIANELYR